MIPLNSKNYLQVGFLIAILFFSRKIVPFVIIYSQILLLTLWYLRDVKRYFIKNNQSYLSPVDGVVKDIEELCVLPGHEGFEWKKITIETGFFDSHIKYAPIGGEVVTQELSKTKKDFDIFQIFREKLFPIIPISFSLKFPVSYTTNLKTMIVDQKNKNTCIVELSSSHFSGISPITASAIDQGGKLGVGQVGAFKFTTDVYIPANSNICVLIGQTMVGSETVLGCYEPIKSIPYQVAPPQEENFADHAKELSSEG